MLDLIKRLVSPIGLLAATLVLLFLLVFWFTTAGTERRIENGLRADFAAAGLLADLQLQAEQMRRYEKEMFIYVADSAARVKYVGEFQRTYSILLATLDSMQAPGSESFGDADRFEMARWKEAALFYGTEFTKLAQRAASLDGDKSVPVQRGERTVEFNAAIGPGKDRFRELIDGARRMRLRREVAAQDTVHEVAAAFGRLRRGVALGGMVLGALLLALLRPRAQVTPGFDPA